MLDELKAHLEEMLRSFRSGVAVYEEHIVEALAKLERAASTEPPAAAATEAPAAPAQMPGFEGVATAEDPQTATVTTDPQPAAAA